MKKFAVLSLLCLFSMAGMAQSLPINIGVHAGWNNTKIGYSSDKKNEEPGYKMSARSGYTVGVFARLNLGKLYLEPALNYSYKESKAEAGTITDSELKYSSIDIPVMVGSYIVKLPVFKLRGFIGPVASFLVQDIELNSKKLDTDKAMWNGKLGVGADVWKLTFDMDYEFGLKKFGANVKRPDSFNITLGFKFI